MKRCAFSGESFRPSLKTEYAQPRTQWVRIFDAYDYLNEKAFEDELVRPEILVWENIHINDKNKKIALDGAYSPERNTIYLRWRAEDKLHILFHEMCHQYVHQVLMNHKVNHGPIFKEVYLNGLYKLNKR